MGVAGQLVAGVGAHEAAEGLLGLGIVGLAQQLQRVVVLLRGRRAAPTQQAEAERDGGRLARGATIGFLTGMLAGMLGVGGGFLIVPALTLFGLPIEKAVGTSLFVISLQSLAGSIGYLEHVAVDVHVVVQLAAAMALGSIGGGLLSRRLPAALLRRLFAGLLVIVALFMLLRNL